MSKIQQSKTLLRIFIKRLIIVFSLSVCPFLILGLALSFNMNFAEKFIVSFWKTILLLINITALYFIVKGLIYKITHRKYYNEGLKALKSYNDNALLSDKDKTRILYLFYYKNFEKFNNSVAAVVQKYDFPKLVFPKSNSLNTGAKNYKTFIDNIVAILNIIGRENFNILTSELMDKAITYLNYDEHNR